MSRSASERAVRLLQTGLERVQSGQLTQARQFCEQALELAPRHPDALHLLGIIALQSRDYLAARDSLEQATAIRPDHPVYQANLAYSYLGLKRLPEALAAFEHAARLTPEDPELQVAAGNCLAMLNRFAEAEEHFRRVAEGHPQYVLAWFNLANAVKDQERYTEARDYYLRVIQLAPDFADAHNTLGIVLHRLGELERSEAAYRTCIGIDSDMLPAYTNLAMVLNDLRRPQEAEALCRQALAKDPDLQIALSLLGKALAAQSRWHEAVSSHEKAVALNPLSAEAAGYLGDALAIGGRYQAALAAFERAISLNPDLAHPRYSKAITLFAHGRVTEGAVDFRCRDSRQQFRTSRPDVVLADELPADLTGRRVCLLGEQGIGDEIFFLRYAPLVKSRGGRVVCHVHPKIAGILSRSGAVDEIVPSTAPIPAADHTLLLGDLIMVLTKPEASEFRLRRMTRQVTGAGHGAGLSFTLRRTVCYPELPLSLTLRPSEESMQKVAVLLEELGPPPYLGLTWRAGTASGDQRGEFWQLHKELPLHAFADAVKAFPGTFLALQRMPQAGEIPALSQRIGRPARDLTGLNEDLEMMLALLAVIDEYVGVSNTNMHLRAGAGRTARVLVPRPAEWRWMAAGDESPWFPGFRVYRQRFDGDWGAALDRLGRDLLAAFGTHTTRSQNH